MLFDRWLVFLVKKAGEQNLWVVQHSPGGQTLGYFTSGWVARWIARELNTAAALPLEPSEYDGSQWEVDPTQ